MSDEGRQEYTRSSCLGRRGLKEEEGNFNSLLKITPRYYGSLFTLFACQIVRSPQCDGSGVRGKKTRKEEEDLRRDTSTKNITVTRL